MNECPHIAGRSANDRIHGRWHGETMYSHYPSEIRGEAVGTLLDVAPELDAALHQMLNSVSVRNPLVEQSAFYEQWRQYMSVAIFPKFVDAHQYLPIFSASNISRAYSEKVTNFFNDLHGMISYPAQKKSERFSALTQKNRFDPIEMNPAWVAIIGEYGLIGPLGFALYKAYEQVYNHRGLLALQMARNFADNACVDNTTGSSAFERDRLGEEKDGVFLCPAHRIVHQHIVYPYALHLGLQLADVVDTFSLLDQSGVGLAKQGVYEKSYMDLIKQSTRWNKHMVRMMELED